MASIFDWLPTASSNTNCDGINTAPGMPVDNTDNVFRAMMAIIRQSFSSTLKNFLAGSVALPVTSGGTGGATAEEARVGLGLGGMATQQADDVNIISGTITGISLKSAGAFGFAATAGGTVTQASSKSTPVTINKNCGRITTHNAALAGTSTVYFVVNNSEVFENDTVNVTLKSGASLPGAYSVYASDVANGSFGIAIHNFNGSPLSDALVLNFAVIKGVVA